MLFLIVACSTHDPWFHDTGPSVDEEPWPDIYTVAGSLTWSLHQPNGQNCEYVETYSATEDLSHPWTCPDCDVQFVADVTADDEECYRKVNDIPPGREYLGFGGGSIYRHTQPNFPLEYLDTGRFFDDGTLTIDAELKSEDGSTLWAQGTLVRTTTTSDGWNGFAPPNTYACGWPKADPPTYDGPWEYHVNQTIPDGWFKDTCDESVRLHDLAGSYLVIDVSAVDCAPCQLMASKEAAFTSAMATEGIDVRSVTLLAPSLAAILDDTPIETLASWKKTYGVTGVVLADRGWGYAIPEHFLGAKNYPTWTVISPDLRAIAIGSGFESYQLVESAIRADLD